MYLRDTDERLQKMVEGKYPAEEFIQLPSGEIVADLISSLSHNQKKRFNALNLPNNDYISNLPAGCIVEVPAWVNTGKIQGEPVGALPTLIGGWCHQQATIHHLNAKAAIEGDRQAALEAMLLDPTAPDRFVAEKCLDAMLEANRQYLPRFFGA
jgi:alpha-galactosidase